MQLVSCCMFSPTFIYLSIYPSILLVLTMYSSPQPASQTQTHSQFSPPSNLPPSALSVTKNDGNSGPHRSDAM